MIFAFAPTLNGPARSPLFPGRPGAPLLGGRLVRVLAPPRFAPMAADSFPLGRVLNPFAPRGEGEINDISSAR